MFMNVSTYTLLAISTLIAILDQATKWWVQQTLVYGESVFVLPFFNWVHVWNTGAAFGLLANAGGWQRYLFIGSASAISILLIYLISKSHQKAEAFAYSLILGGAAGNLFDRIFRGYVIDSFDFYWRSWHWPAFNVADIAIVLGVLLIISKSLISKNKNSDIN